MAAYNAQQYRAVSFEAKVSEVYAQMVTIPEISIPLATTAMGSPFIPGQNIKATFVLDSSTNEVVSWWAKPGTRPAAGEGA
ncbi:MAG: hypothetical protein EBZ48_14175 [Proteobacteria bacterium]|nr:hypothetical protein [Pseudomonadota bacterium]